MSVDVSKDSTIVNIRNIDEDMTNEQLEDLFANYGTVTSCKILYSEHVGRFAYVAFQDPDAAEEAIIELNGQELIQGQRISVKRTREKIIRNSKFKRNAESSDSTTVNRGEVFVKHLAPEIDADCLRSSFEHCGSILSVKVITENGRSKGYGFVSFGTPEEANTAIKEMNGRLVLGQSIHVSLARGTDHSKRAQNVCSNAPDVNRGEIFVKFLAEHESSEDLRQMFNHCGTILSSKVIVENGRSKGYGFVTFATTEEANRAVEEMNGRQIGRALGQSLHVSLACGADRSKTAQNGCPNTSSANRAEVFVNHLAEHVSEHDLRLVFNHCGTILSTNVITEHGRSKGYGFVNFASPEEANKAVEKMNGRLAFGKTLKVSIACGTDRSKIAQKRNEVLVRHLHRAADAAYLRECFEHCGKIVSTKVIMDQMGISKGYGFVSFETPEEASRAVDRMNGRLTFGQAEPMRVSLACDAARSNNARYDFLFPYDHTAREHRRLRSASYVRQLQRQIRPGPEDPDSDYDPYE